MSQRGIDPVGFAEKVLALLELGSFSATYKYALFTAIMDLCLESAMRSGTDDTVITTRQLAERVVELYWQLSPTTNFSPFSAPSMAISRKVVRRSRH